MAERDGIFDAKMELKLTSCQSISPFGEAVEVTNLRGATAFAVHVYVDPKGHCEPCVDVAKNCGRYPRLIVLRPMSVQFREKKVNPVGNEDPWPVGPWLDMSASKITPDRLATLLTFEAPGSVKLADKKHPGLGRPQFYFDGLLNLLLDECVEAADRKLEEHENCESEPPARLTFYLDKLELAANGTEPKNENDGEITRKLYAVTVQFIAAYGKFPVGSDGVRTV